jgi:hypothetical protein
MNFFFLLKKKDINSTLNIPTFQNNGKTSNKLNLYRARIIEEKWNIQNTLKKKDKDFYKIDSSEYEEDDIFFLAESKNFHNKDLTNELLNINGFTETYPAYRANLKIFYKKMGFSSYQSEYPFNMTKNKGSTLSPLKVLLTKNIEKNLIFLKNISHLPIKKKFKVYIFDIIRFIIVKTFDCFTNSSNYFEINDQLINENYYIFSENNLVLPLFVSVNNLHISFEHTQPPQLIIHRENKIIVKKIKDKIYEKIIKK